MMATGGLLHINGGIGRNDGSKSSSNNVAVPVELLSHSQRADSTGAKPLCQTIALPPKLRHYKACPPCRCLIASDSALACRLHRSVRYHFAVAPDQFCGRSELACTCLWAWTRAEAGTNTISCHPGAGKYISFTTPWSYPVAQSCWQLPSIGRWLRIFSRNFSTARTASEACGGWPGLPQDHPVLSSSAVLLQGPQRPQARLRLLFQRCLYPAAAQLLQALMNNTDSPSNGAVKLLRPAPALNVPVAETSPFCGLNHSYW